MPKLLFLTVTFDTFSIGHGLCFTPLTPVSPPLQTDGNGEADGAADGDVVEGVEQLREHQRVQAAVQRHRPREH